ncbi:hypothetical protein Achl_4223 (plasmid) [Pseudarthrobacter chlorophenolicus A6]|uniref:Uncharacterized protein n=1 Tax=Pseudarthrobacter chlorophenolicus (strain ATCC 700700 / DSM 12829 / CIP 107037 / JCM 12360 / KCTC 9906 / NCIMB 13794 / A6) TaxID=452863 RepID=B8HIC7_PSECP|nr:hypothetical protein [Pseudarthrobacter chlorophenolicus]ACL42174.1 hypothetical protein Achl_4223 [Pseudarthrobacter chlorophenolicus A6]SDQ14419.1 hypothetical protein SAMN04489738_0281 [Pseudarthrobacter chlorophenolicus]
MSDDNQPGEQDPRAYFIIRDLAADLVDVVDEVQFQPLFRKHPEILSVVALVPGEHLAGYHDVWLTLWRGHRDGTGQDNSESPLWLRIDQLEARSAEDWVQPVDASQAGYGLSLPETGRPEGLQRCVDILLKLLDVASPVHHGQTDKDLVYGALNQTLEEGFTGQSFEGGHHGAEDSPVAELEQLCADSDLESVEFEEYGVPGAGGFATKTFLDIGDQLAMKVWSTADGTDWIDVAGRVQSMDAPELVFPGEDQEEADLVAAMAEQLAEIHDVAAAIYEELDPEEPGTVLDLLNSVAYAALNGAAEMHGPHVQPWHRLVDQFTEHCRLGFLAGVMLEESPFGNLNIRATTFDPATRKTTDLQVYWKQDDEGEVPEHWLSVGTATGPAHDVDPEYPELLADVPSENREHIRHAISHLHEMVHLAGSVLEAKTAEASRFLENRQTAESVPDTLQHIMIRSTIEDTIAGLNGVALLHTGAMPD